MRKPRFTKLVDPITRPTEAAARRTPCNRPLVARAGKSARAIPTVCNAVFVLVGAGGQGSAASDGKHREHSQRERHRDANHFAVGQTCGISLLLLFTDVATKQVGTHDQILFRNKNNAPV